MTVLGIMRDRKWPIVGCVVLFTVITFVVILVWRIYAPRYTAVARLGVKPREENPYMTGHSGFHGDKLPGPKAAHTEMLQRESVLIRTLYSPKVKDTGWYKRDPEGARERLAEILDVTPVPEANLIAISITDVAPRKQDRIELAEIANAVAMAFVQEVQGFASQSRVRPIKRLRDKLADLREMSDIIRAQIKKRLPGIETIQKRVAAHGARLEELGAKVIELVQANAQIEGTLKDLEKHTKAGTLSQMPEVAAMVEKDPNVRAWREEESRVQSYLDLLIIRRLDVPHGSVSFLRIALATIREKLARAAKEAVPVQAQALKEQFLARLEQVTGQLLSIKGLASDIHETVEVDLARILLETRDLRAREKGIAEDIRRISDTLLMLKALAEADRPVWLHARATTPKTITMPKWTLTMPLGALFGLAVGLGMALYLGPKTKREGGKVLL